MNDFEGEINFRWKSERVNWLISSWINKWREKNFFQINKSRGEKWKELFVKWMNQWMNKLIGSKQILQGNLHSQPNNEIFR